MRRGDALFGAYVPGNSVLHRMGAGWKYLLLVAPAVLLLVVRSPWLALALVAIDAALMVACRLPLRTGLGLGWVLVVMLVVLAGYNVWFVGWRSAVVVVGNIVACLYASRLLVLTTPGPALIDALVAGARPLRVVHVSPERVGLAVAIMLRSIPYLIGSFDEVRAAARARGQERNIVGQLTPVVVDAVAYAQRTGEALAARGLADD